jgi:galactonate dehydratase
MIEDLADQALVGHDPHNAEELFDRIYGRAGYSHVPELTKLAILSAFDMACWDIAGKYLGQPVHRLLGGRVRDKVRTYTYLYAERDEQNLGRSLRELWLDPGHAARRARHYVDLGFTAVKLDPFALSLAEDQALGQTVAIQFTMSALSNAEEVIGAIRSEVGDAADILIGTHGQMTAAAAIFNFDLGLVGGILEGRKIATMAEPHYVQISPHVYGGPMIAAASIQLALCSQNFLIMEGIERLDGIYDELIDPPFTWQGGFVVPSEGPGLGHDLREDVARSLRPDGPGPSLIRVY